MNLDDRFYQGITAYQRMVGNAGPQANSAPAPAPGAGTAPDPVPADEDEHPGCEQPRTGR
jgi:hypothetical protein